MTGGPAGALHAPDIPGSLADAVTLLLSARQVWIGTHRDPDADAIGSLLGLGRVLSGLGAQVTVACADPAPEQTAFLPGARGIVAHGPEGADVAVAVDAGDFDRLGGMVTTTTWAALPTLVIDHHASNPGFGTVNVIAPQVSSTAELVLELAKAMAAPVDEGAALCLLTGLVSDTLGFRTTNTTAATLRRAAELMALGPSLPEVADRLFASRPLPAMRLIGSALATLEVRGRVGVARLMQGDFAAAGAAAEHARGISGFLATTEELDAVALLRERDDDTVDVSMRSRAGTDLGPVADRLGGGGHPQAAGARVSGSMSEAVDAVWGALEAELARP